MRIPLVLVTTLILLSTATAGHGECQTSSPEITTPATGVSANGGPGIYYVDNDMCQPDCLFSVWVYEETNGEPGLQRGDDITGDCPRETDTIIL